MSNSFLFIIPLTPESHLTPLRKELQQLCFKTLLSQTYANWKVLLIGTDKPTGTEDERFIHVKEEGFKELKLQYAVKYINENELGCDYIIRLDDDDVFNPTILNKYKNSKADVIVDLKHNFIEWSSKQCSSDFRPWFANTVLHKKENALASYGEIARKGIDQLNEIVTLIETDHSRMHNYYKSKVVIFETKTPIYLRVLNEDSITSNAGKSYAHYLEEFGEWSLPLPLVFGDLIKNLDGKTEIKVKKVGLKKKVYNHYAIQKFKRLFK